MSLHCDGVEAGDKPCLVVVSNYWQLLYTLIELCVDGVQKKEWKKVFIIGYLTYNSKSIYCGVWNKKEELNDGCSWDNDELLWSDWESDEASWWACGNTVLGGCGMEPNCKLFEREKWEYGVVQVQEEELKCKG